jgi:hypothetical protein
VRGLCHELNEFQMDEELFFTCALLVEHIDVAELLEIDGCGLSNGANQSSAFMRLAPRV